MGAGPAGSTATDVMAIGSMVSESGSSASLWEGEQQKSMAIRGTSSPSAAPMSQANRKHYERQKERSKNVGRPPHMTEATLSPETKQKIAKMSSDSLDYKRLLAAATVAVEQLGPELAKCRHEANLLAIRVGELTTQLLDAGATAKLQADVIRSLQAELAELRTAQRPGPTRQAMREAEANRLPVKTTPEEAAVVRDAWTNCPGGVIALEQMAAAIDQLRERPLTLAGGGLSKGVDVTENCAEIAKQLNARLAGGGMTIEERARCVAFSLAGQSNADAIVFLKNQFEHIVAVAAKEAECLKLAQTACQLERERLEKRFNEADAHWQKMYIEQGERHTAELARAKTNIDDSWHATHEETVQLHAAELAQERDKQLEIYDGAKAAAYEEVTAWLDRKRHPVIAEDVRREFSKLLSERAAKPQEPSMADQIYQRTTELVDQHNATLAKPLERQPCPSCNRNDTACTPGHCLVRNREPQEGPAGMGRIYTAFELTEADQAVLDRLAADNSIPKSEGEDLPTADKATLLAKRRPKQMADGPTPQEARREDNGPVCENCNDTGKIWSRSSAQQVDCPACTEAPISKPQEICGACGKAGCTDIHADESDITHEFRPGAQEEGPEVDRLKEAKAVAFMEQAGIPVDGLGPDAPEVEHKPAILDIGLIRGYFTWDKSFVQVIVGEVGP